MTPMQMKHIIRLLGRTPRHRATVYDTAPADRYRASFAATRLFIGKDCLPAYGKMAGSAATID